MRATPQLNLRIWTVRKYSPGCAGKPGLNRVVAKFKLTRLSEADLEAILEYSLKTWGQNQALRYLGDLQACFQQLADRPRLGRSCDSIRNGLQRMEHGRHVIFNRSKKYGIRIIRILLQSMLPDQYLLDEEA